MHILIVASSSQPPMLETARGLVTAAVEKGHRVSVFFYMDAVSLLGASETVEWLTPLTSSGVRLLVCRTSAMERGVELEANTVDGMEVSSLGELVELLDGCDRALFMG